MMSRRGRDIGNIGACYWREIVAVLCLKAAGLALLYFVFLGPSHRPPVASDGAAEHLLTQPKEGTGNDR